MELAVVRNCAKVNRELKVALACEPHWLEVSRDELRSRKERLSSLLGRLRSKQNTSKAELLSPDEFELLDELWQMLNEVLS